jgi:hypothetical protein
MPVFAVTQRAGVVAVVAGSGEELVELGGCPHSRGGARQWPSFRGVGEAGGVGDDESASGGVVEGAAQDHVDLDDCLWVEAACAVGAAVVGELGV